MAVEDPLYVGMRPLGWFLLIGLALITAVFILHNCTHLLPEAAP